MRCYYQVINIFLKITNVEFNKTIFVLFSGFMQFQPRFKRLENFKEFLQNVRTQAFASRVILHQKQEREEFCDSTANTRSKYLPFTRNKRN